MNKYTQIIITGGFLVAVTFFAVRCAQDCVKTGKKQNQAYKIFREAEKHFDKNHNNILERNEVVDMAVELGYDGVFQDVPLTSSFTTNDGVNCHLDIDCGRNYTTQVDFPLSKLEEAIKDKN